jgi:hypothetical protein
MGSLFAVRIADAALRLALAVVLIIVAAKLSTDLWPLP